MDENPSWVAGECRNAREEKPWLMVPSKPLVGVSIVEIQVFRFMSFTFCLACQLAG